MAIKNIHLGFKDRDIHQLTQYIDFESIRISIIEQIKTEVVLKSDDIQKKMELDHPIFISEISNMMEIIEQFLNPYISEKGLLLLFEGKERFGVNTEQSKFKSFSSVLSSRNFWDQNSFVFDSLGKVYLISEISNQKVKLIFVFTGIKWTLNDVHLDLSHSSTDDIIQFMDKYSETLNLSFKD